MNPAQLNLRERQEFDAQKVRTLQPSEYGQGPDFAPEAGCELAGELIDHILQSPWSKPRLHQLFCHCESVNVEEAIEAA